MATPPPNRKPPTSKDKIQAQVAQALDRREQVQAEQQLALQQLLARAKVKELTAFARWQKLALSLQKAAKDRSNEPLENRHQAALVKLVGHLSKYATPASKAKELSALARPAAKFLSETRAPRSALAAKREISQEDAFHFLQLVLVFLLLTQKVLRKFKLVAR